MTGGIARRRLLLAGGAAAAAGIAMRAGSGSAAATPRRLPPVDSIDQSDPALLGAVEAAVLLRSSALHPRELLDACIDRSGRFDGEVGAWVRVYPDLAYEAADVAANRLNAARNAGAIDDVPLVCGLPVALKDLFAVAGFPLTASSRVLEGNVAAGDSGVWRRLRDDGAVLLGHVHTDEFGLGVATPQVGNPWDITQSPGGSSGGSAAALAARFVPLAVGTDTGGSVRIPAAACGISAIKPTIGRVTNSGVIPLVWTRDHVGAMGRSIADVSLLLSCLAGADPADPVTFSAQAERNADFPVSAVGGSAPLAGRRIGVPHGSLDVLPAALRGLFDEFLDVAQALGAEFRPVSMPQTPVALLAGDRAEVGTYHRQFADRVSQYRADLIPFVVRALASQGAPAADYLLLLQERAQFQRDYNSMFASEELDAIVLPGATVDGVARDAWLGMNSLSSSGADVNWANYSGAPALALPVGRSPATGMPFGVQLGGFPWRDSDLLAIGLELQESLPQWREVPRLAPARRDLPAVAVGPPGPGPDPTNTVGASAPVRVLATTISG